MTGVSLLAGTVNAKRLEFIHELVPRVATVAVLNNPIVTEAESRLRDLQEGARTLGLRLLFQTVGSERELNAAFATIAVGGIGCIWGGLAADARGRERLVILSMAASGACA